MPDISFQDARSAKKLLVRATLVLAGNGVTRAQLFVKIGTIIDVIKAFSTATDMAIELDRYGEMYTILQHGGFGSDQESSPADECLLGEIDDPIPLSFPNLSSFAIWIDCAWLRGLYKVVPPRWPSGLQHYRPHEEPERAGLAAKEGQGMTRVREELRRR